jgi:type II secretory pathway pseudopilin PulG
MKNHLPRHSPKAFSLVEVILAVGVLGIAILTLVGLVSASFLQVDNIVQTNRALSVISSVNAVLNNPEFIGGKKIKDIDSTTAPKFNAIYNYVREAVNGTNKTLYYLTTVTNNAQTNTTGSSTLIYNPTGTNLTRQQYTSLNGTGTVFRVTLSISKHLEGQRIELNAEGVPTEAIYSGGMLPPSAENFAPAAIPLHIEVFPYQFGNTTGAQPAQPILTQELVLTR